MRPPFFVDHSGNGGRIPVKGCFVASCVLCGKKQYLSRLALSRRTRQMCGCGGALELSEQTQKREGLAPTREEGRALNETRRCVFCFTKLRISNEDNVCGSLECQKIKSILRSNGIVLKKTSVVEMAVINRTGKIPGEHSSLDSLTFDRPLSDRGYRIVGLRKGSSVERVFIVDLALAKVTMAKVSDSDSRAGKWLNDRDACPRQVCV